MKEVEHEIINELKQEQKKHKEMLNRLVLERTKNTSDKKFKIEEIKYWSQYFNISLTSLMREILVINNDEYQKLLKGQIRKVNSKDFNKAKEIMLGRKQKKYYANRNLNRRNYFNREKILKESQRLQINTVDYVVGILNKNKQSFRRVMRDTKSKKRLYIGKYVNTRLPISYIENNYDDMIAMSSSALNKTSKMLGIYVLEQDRKDIIQDCMCYMMEQGNMLDKNSKPLIKEYLATKNQKRKMYNKAYFYVLNQLRTYNVKHSSYNDKIEYKKFEPSFCDNDIEEYIKNKFEDELTRYIFSMIYKEGNTEETRSKIINKFHITSEKIEETIDLYVKELM